MAIRPSGENTQGRTQTKSAYGEAIRLDIATILARIEQVERENKPDGLIWERIMTCDVPRLRRYLTPDLLKQLDEYNGQSDAT